MSLFTYTVRRGVLAAVAAIAAVSLTFLVVATNRFYPVDVPLTEQYVDHVLGVLRFEWGYSESLDRPVGAVLAEAIPRTLAYVLPAILLTYTVGILAGLAAAYGSSTRDGAIRVFAYVLLGVPTMVLGTMVAFQLMNHVDWASHPIWCTGQGVRRRCWPPFIMSSNPFLQPVSWGPSGSYGWPNTVPWERVSYRYLLPASVLSVGLATGLFRQARRAALEH